MAKYKTKSEQDYMSRVADLGCICCGQPAELHHPRRHTGLGLRSSNYDVIPLCPNHHRLGKVSIHLGKAQFERTFGTEKDLLKKVKKGLEDLITLPSIQDPVKCHLIGQKNFIAI